MDGIDAALVEISADAASIVACHSHPYPPTVTRALRDAIAKPDIVGADQLGQLDRSVGEAFGEAARDLLKSAGVAAKQVVAIGSHGQTIRHRPDSEPAFTLQIGDPATVAAITGVTVVADFRRADIARGGQGAPLAPAFHHWLFADTADAVLNLGGIANVTLLAADPEEVLGFDTGPANTLLDAWCQRHQGKAFDRDGRWAATGQADGALLSKLLEDRYFALAGPKSTGFEYFNLNWLDTMLTEFDASPVDVQATLIELSARSIALGLRQAGRPVARLLACGGGVHNATLMRAISTALEPSQVMTTASQGIDPDWVEAAAFAWLARQTLKGLPGNLPSVTGADARAVLGSIHPAATGRTLLT